MLPKGRHITCIHNPAAGYEAELGIGTLRPATAPKRVVVVGGGPAGMKVAETAARRGHDVRLLERRDHLGGQVRIATSVPGREEVGEVVRYLETQVRKLGVDVRCGVTATADDEALADAETVVVATGSRPVRRLIGVRSYQLEGVPGLELPHVLDSWDLLEGGAEPGKSVVVVDDGEGSWKALSIAAHLARTGHEVQIVTPLPFVAAALGPYSIGPYMRTVFSLGIVTHPFAIVQAVTETTVELLRGGPARDAERRRFRGALWLAPAHERHLLDLRARAWTSRAPETPSPRGTMLPRRARGERIDGRSDPSMTRSSR